MLGGLFKPKWQHASAKVRIQALANLGADSTELIQLAENDPDTGVRLEAIARLTDMPALIQLGKRADAIGERAQQRLVTLSGDNSSHDEALVEVFDWLKSTPALVQSIARDSERGAALRKLAVAEVNDEGLLFKIAGADGSRELQYLAASKINDTAKLKQLEKTQGRNNKKLRQLLKERMAAEQAVQERQQVLESLCAELEVLGHSGHWAQDKTRHRVLHQSWKQQSEQADIPELLVKRFHDAEKEFNGRLDAYEQQQAALAPLQEAFEQCLQDAGTLQQALADTPEQFTLTSIDKQLEQLQERWVAAETLPDEEKQAALNERWVAMFVGLTDKRDELSGDLSAVDALKACCQRVEGLRKSTKPLQGKRLTNLQAEWIKLRRPRQMEAVVAGLEGRFHQAMDSLNARLIREAGEREQQVGEMLSRLDQMEADLEQEKYGEAVDIHREVSAQLKDMTDLPAKDRTKLDQRLRAAAPMVMEFKDWRRWGTDQAREHLIETAQRLENDASMDPEQRAKEIKALRQEWRKLAQMEPGKQRQQWKDFDSKVTAAYEPSKQHFAEQARQRAEHLRQREGVCIQLETMRDVTDWENVDWKAQLAGINELRKAWKRCGTVGHKEWKAINQRFNDAMDALEVQLKGEREHNFKARQRLVEQAEALLELEDIQAATTEAKALQSHWQITVPSRPKEEQKLWKAFRSPIDEVFKRLGNERQSRRSETNQRIQQKEQVCEQLESLLTLTDEEFSVQTRELDNIRSHFSAVREIPKAVHRKLEDRFNSAEQAVLSRMDQLVWRKHLTGLDELAQDSGDLKAAEATAEVMEANQLEGETLCLQLEILLDIDTPSAFRQIRMEYQVSQMSEAMRSRNEAQDEREQGIGLLSAWYQLGAMPADAVTDQQARIEAARQTIAK
ncbi:MAG: DUF349 domain-containing protein [Thiolinea sp.]